MKKKIYIIMILYPFFLCAQNPLYKSSSMTYMWVNLGNADFSAGATSSTCLAFSPSGQPYVAYEDYENSKKATLMKFDGNNWVSVGNMGFSAGEAWGPSLAFSPDGQPFIAFTDHLNSNKATTMKFDGNNWVNVGIAGFSAGNAESI